MNSVKEQIRIHVRRQVARRIRDQASARASDQAFVVVRRFSTNSVIGHVSSQLRLVRTSNETS